MGNRNGAVLNIGLQVTYPDGSRRNNTVGRALGLLRQCRTITGRALRVLHWRVMESNTEPTLVVKINRGMSEGEAARLANLLHQDAIAQLAGKRTGLFGPRASAWGAFNRKFFLTF